jgi:hypothetical protein
MAFTNYSYQNQFVITFPQIVMEQVQAIQKIYSKELRNGDKILKNAIGEQIIEGEDTRYSFLQAVEMFGSLLYPYFIENASEDYKGISKEEFDNYCDLLDKELIEFLEDKDFQKLAKQVFFIEDNKSIADIIKEDEVKRNQLNLFFLNYKIKESRKIFRRLVQLFYDNDFLTTTGFSDSANVGGTEAYDESSDGSLEFSDIED